MNSKPSWSRRTFVTSVMALVATPALRTGARADTPLIQRCSLATAPSHTRNAVIRDYLGKIETAAAGKIKTQLFESGQLTQRGEHHADYCDGARGRTLADGIGRPCPPHRIWPRSRPGRAAAWLLNDPSRRPARTFHDAALGFVRGCPALRAGRSPPRCLRHHPAAISAGSPGYRAVAGQVKRPR